MRNVLLLALVALLLIACSTNGIKTAINKYESAAKEVDLGDTKEMVLAKLLPSEENLKQAYRKNPEKFQSSEGLVEIYFFRSSWQSDGLTTDDEFTPYVFLDETLVAVGWSALGGPKTQGQATQGSGFGQPYGFSQFYRNERIKDQIMIHGAGGCTPNFSTGGCL